MPAAPGKSGNSIATGAIALVVLAIVVWVAFGNDKGPSSGGDSPAETTAAKHLSGTFVSWSPVDEGDGYAYFTVTNNGTSTETAMCTIQVEDDFGDFRQGFDSLVGEAVGPGKTISGKVALSVGKGSFLINRGEVTDC